MVILRPGCGDACALIYADQILEVLEADRKAEMEELKADIERLRKG